MSSKLHELGFPYLQVILEEVFLLPPPFLGPSPLAQEATVADLIAVSEMKSDEVLRRLRQLRKWSEGIVLSEQEVAELNNVVVLELSDEFLRPQEFIELYHKIVNNHKTLVLYGKDSARVYSAALYCKEIGLKKVYCNFCNIACALT